MEVGDMLGYLSVAGAIVSLVSAVVATTLGIWTAQQTRQAQQEEAYRAIHALYDKMVQYKLDNPDIVQRARTWEDSKIATMYQADSEEGAAWSRYCTFVELCIGFANAVLQARSRRLMGKSEYEDYWERLVRLVITEHFPIIGGYFLEGPYISRYLRDYVRALSADGWDWSIQHARLTEPPIGSVEEA
ncbi:MAG: hypothetical protein QMD96_02315 [Anaerosomatales bacterium]|nr:hypothetical protein [Anaerosomatales bacterium]